jgi:hypothetical protein
MSSNNSLSWSNNYSVWPSCKRRFCEVPNESMFLVKRISYATMRRTHVALRFTRRHSGPACPDSQLRNNYLCAEAHSCRIIKKFVQQGRRGFETGGVPSGAHGATNKEHHVCARRRVGEAAGSPLRISMNRERSWRAFSASC